MDGVTTITGDDNTADNGGCRQIGDYKVVKTNRLNTAIQDLTLAEIRIIQLAIVDGRERYNGLTSKTPVRVCAKRYAELFDTTTQNAYIILKNAEKELFNREFYFLTKDANDNLTPSKFRWLQGVTYHKSKGFIELFFSDVVIQEITRIDGTKQIFTQYFLKNTSGLEKMYSVRLYELIIQWKKSCVTRFFDLKTFRRQMGVADNEYKRMTDFKSRVLDSAISEINEKTNITAKYNQVKEGRKIIGFIFSFKFKDKKDEAIEGAVEKRILSHDEWVKYLGVKEINGMSYEQANLYSRILHTDHAIVGNFNVTTHDEARMILAERLQQPKYVIDYLPKLLKCKHPFQPNTVLKCHKSFYRRIAQAEKLSKRFKDDDQKDCVA